MSCCSSRTSRDRLVSSGLASRLRRGVVAAAHRRSARRRRCPTARGRSGAARGARRGARRARPAPAGARGRAGWRRRPRSRSGRALRPRLVAQLLAGVVEQLGRAGGVEGVAEPAPQLRLPAQVVVERVAVAALVAAGRPGAQHLGPRLAVVVEHPGQPSRHRQPTAGPRRRRRPASLRRGAGRASWPRTPSATAASMTSSSGQTDRAGAQRSTASACSVDEAASASSTSVLGHGNATLAQTPSPDDVPRTWDSRCASQRSTPLAGHRHHLGGERVRRRHGEHLAEAAGQRGAARRPVRDEHDPPSPPTVPVERLSLPASRPML